MNKFDPAIEFQNVSFRRGKLPILKDISGSIYKGKVTTLVGPSGAGKTTLLKLCNGLISPTQGDVLIDHQSVLTYEPTTLRRNIGIVLQNAPILRGTVFDNLSLPLKLQKRSLTKEEAISILDTVGLDESFLERDATVLSGGQKQKLAISRTLINHSKILLLDEITSALDPVSVHEIEQLIMKINKKYNVTIIWITHNIHQATELGDYIWVMMNGELIESGDKSILFNTKNKHVQNFIEGNLKG